MVNAVRHIYGNTASSNLHKEERASHSRNLATMTGRNVLKLNTLNVWD